MSQLQKRRSAQLTIRSDSEVLTPLSTACIQSGEIYYLIFILLPTVVSGQYPSSLSAIALITRTLLFSLLLHPCSPPYLRQAHEGPQPSLYALILRASQGHTDPSPESFRSWEAWRIDRWESLPEGWVQGARSKIAELGGIAAELL